MNKYIKLKVWHGLGMNKSGGSSVGGDSRVLNISNITAVGIIHLVVDGLGPAVGKVDGVGSGGGVTVTVLPGVEGGAGVVISHGVVVGVHSRGINSSVDRGVHKRSMVDDGSVDNRGGMDQGSSVHNGTVDKGSSMVDRGGMHHRGGMVDRGSVVDRGMGESSRSMNSYSSLLISSVSMDALGSSMGLAADGSVSSSMRLVDSVAD